MSLLLDTGQCDHSRPVGADSHGWVSEEYLSLGVIRVNVQPSREVGNPSAASGRGSESGGPGAPGVARYGTVYADPDADLRAGDRLTTVYGETWQLLSAQVVPGPFGALDVLRCTAHVWEEPS